MQLPDNASSYTRKAVPLILARFPGWEQYATIEEASDGTSTIEFLLPSPTGNTRSGLWVSTSCDELTIGFEATHRHGFKNEDHDMLDFAEAILREEVVAIGGYCNDELRVATSCKTDEIDNRMDQLHRDHDYISRFTVRSWNGKYDQDVDASGSLSPGGERG